MSKLITSVHGSCACFPHATPRPPGINPNPHIGQASTEEPVKQCCLQRLPTSGRSLGFHNFPGTSQPVSQKSPHTKFQGGSTGLEKAHLPY